VILAESIRLLPRDTRQILTKTSENLVHSAARVGVGLRA
jgi:hypothetical protein